MRRRKLFRVLVVLAAGGVLLLAGAAAAAWLALRASLPRTEGAVRVAELEGTVEIARDALGVATIRAGSYADAALGQGFVHAQDRFFQMDLSRRAAAGEAAALFGERAVELDRRMRRYRFRHRAAAVLEALPERHRRLIDAYTAGVNAGLADLGARPPEYFLLRARPDPWVAEDTVLLLYMFIRGLSMNHVFERSNGTLLAAVGPDLFEFLTPDTSRFDAPLVAGNPHDGHALDAIPGPEIVDLRGREPSPDRDIVKPFGASAGSNSFAIAGSRSAHGGAVLANDPHLALGVPNVWHRVELSVPGWTARGVSPPGVPGIIIGASDALAWGATNSNADQADLVVIETDPADPSRYLTPDGSEPFTRVVETIEARGGDDVQLAVRETRWGPVTGEDSAGRPLAMHWTALEPGGADFALLDVAAAATLEDGLAILRRWRGPSINWLLADDRGRIGWTVNGPLPVRRGFDGRAPVSWARGEARWDGYIADDELPMIVDPPDGVLFTANNRTLPLPASRRLSRLWMLPVRAKRLEELLQGRSGLAERDLLAMQLDTRSAMHDFLVDVALEASAGDLDPLVGRARRHLEAYNGRADADQPGFRILHVFYGRLIEAVLGPLVAPAAEAEEAFAYNWPIADEPFRRILKRRPAHLLPPGHGSWEEFLRVEFAETVRLLDASDPDLDAPWGAANRAAIRHPLARATPWLGRWLDMPARPLAGWRSTVRVATPRYGATLRLVASPGRLSEALFHMPAGQSGHVLSPHYDDGHAAWREGRPAPLAAGPPVATLTLEPGG